VKFSPVEEIAYNLQMPIFNNFVSWHPKKVPKVLFLQLSGNTGGDQFF